MRFKLIFLLLLAQSLSILGSDLRIVPSWNSNSSENTVFAHRPYNHDRVVPQINIVPLGVRQHDVPTAPKNPWQSPSIVNSNEYVKLNDNVNAKTYPTPRPRIDETNANSNSKLDIPTPRARIEPLPENESINKKPFDIVYHAMPIKLDSEINDEGVRGQQEQILIIEDVSSSEEDVKNDEISNAEIQKYIDAVDAEIRRKGPQQEVKEKIVDAKLGLRKYVVSDYEASKVKPSGGLFYNIGLGDAKASKPMSNIVYKREAPKDNRGSMSSDNGKVTNERKTSGGLSYNIGFGDAKASKPELSSSPRHRRSIEVTDQQNETQKWHKSLHADSSSEELTRPDQQANQKIFDEILKKSMKDHQKQDSAHIQQVQRLPHRGPTIKNSSFLAIDPPESSESASNESDVLVIERTIVLDKSDGNRTQSVFIEDSDVHFNVITVENDKDELKSENNVKARSFWKDGFTIGLHVSPLAMCLFTALVLLMLLMRLALKVHKKRLENKMISTQQPGSSGKKKHEFDDISLRTESTA